MQLIKVYLVRHGQSTYQSLKIVSGMNEFGLSGLGKVQSQKAGIILSNIRFDEVYTSDFKRCIESYSQIERQLKYKPTNITYTPLLRERNPGEDILKSYSDVQQSIKTEQNQIDIETRIRQFFTELIKNQFYKKSSQFCFNKYFNAAYVNNSLYASSVQYFNSRQKDLRSTNVLVISHCGFIVEAISLLQQNKLNNHVYARNGAIFLLEIEAESPDEWKCNISLSNYQQQINTPFDQIY